MDELAEYFAQAQARFTAACCTAGSEERQARLSGCALRLRFAGQSLQPKLLPALGHVLEEASDTPPALTLLIWESASAGGWLPLPPWETLAYVERAGIRRYQDSRFFLAYDRNTNVFTGMDLAAAVGIYWTRDAAWIPYFETAAPMRHLLQAWLNQRSAFLCHGAAVGAAAGAVLLAGRGGMGKSTTSLLCLQAGFAFLGDDFVLIDDAPTPAVHALYCSAKLNADAVGWLPALRPLVTNMDEVGPWEKALLFLYPDYQQQLVAQLPLRAIVVPSPSSGSRAVLEPMPASETFRLLAPDTVFRGQGDAPRVLGLYRRLTVHLPAYRLHLGDTPAAVPDVLQALLAGVSP